MTMSRTTLTIQPSMLQEDWEFGVLGIYNYRKIGKFEPYFQFIRHYHDQLEGDICEVGVYRGSSLLATALLLKELGSSKKVYGYDSFQGFPTADPQDELGRFDDLYDQGRIDRSHHNDVHRNYRYRSFMLGGQLTPTNISSSGNFDQTSLDLLNKKIELLGLDNIEIVQGYYGDTMPTRPSVSDGRRFFAGLLDCDLYDSHQIAWSYLWDRLVPGGYVFIDEYYSLKFPGSRMATDEFFASRSEKPRKHPRIPGEFERWYVKKNKQG